MGYLITDTLRAAQEYYREESKRQASFGLLPPVIPEFTLFNDVTINHDGTVMLLIEQGFGRHCFDVPVAYVFEIAMALGFGRLRINSRGKSKAEGTASAYVRCDIWRGRGKLSLNMQANRMIADVPVGRRVRDNPTDYHNHLRECLITDENPVEYGPGKAWTTRRDAIEAMLEGFDASSATVRSAIGRSDLEHLLSGLLALADQRSAERQMLNSKRTAQ
jgi:hypothetical protein